MVHMRLSLWARLSNSICGSTSIAMPRSTARENQSISPPEGMLSSNPPTTSNASRRATSVEGSQPG